MRIQHNIMAMSAYRNYTNNVSAMKKNLEKLSSGYKINRAGDDAAGLAISEKMRAQITGLETAQKNAKDGISLVQTAEGALTEVHDMLNRMVELATQSANGTYDNTTDRAQLQKEVDQLRSEIDRIADSSNFNGIKLLNGSMQEGFDTKTAAEAELTAAQNELAAAQKNLADGNPAVEKKLTTFDELGLPAVWDGASPTPAQKAVDTHNKTLLQTTAANGTKPKFSIELDGLSHKLTTAGNDALTLKVGGVEIKDAAGNSIKVAGGQGATLTDEQLASLYDGAKVTLGSGADAVNYTATVNGTRITFEADADPAAGKVINAHYDVTFTPVASVPADPTTPANGQLAKYDIDLTGLTATGADTKIDGQTVTFATDIDTTAKNFVKTYNNDAAKKYTASYDNATKKITLTAKSAGYVANGPAVEGTFTGPANAPTAAQTQAGENAGDQAGDKAVYEIDLTGGATGDLNGKTIDGVTITWNNDLNDTLNDFVATYNATAGKGYIASTDGTKVTLTARQTGAVAADPTTNITTLGGGTAPTVEEKTEGTNSTWGKLDGTKGTINAGTVDINVNTAAKDKQLANTVLDLTGKFTDGAKIKLGDTTYTIKVGANSKVATGTTNVVDLSAYTGTEGDFNAIAASKLTEAAKDNTVFSVGQGNTAGKITLQQLDDAAATKDMTTKEKLASYIEVTYMAPGDNSQAAKDAAKAAVDAAQAKVTAAQEKVDNAIVGKKLMLQIGDTADSFNQLKVDIKDMHASSLGKELDADGNPVVGDKNISLQQINIKDQDDAAAAIDVIKRAINQVSDVRGTLGATQNRLDHTINNLSVMTENIQDAESTIRDVDVAEEMMAYTKNNILIQSAQAMLAQANQVPQGVLQLLQ